MNKLHKWIHDNRPRHQRLMAFALSNVERSAAYQREAQGHLSTPPPFVSMAARLGVWALQDAIEMVVDCGCPRDMWPERVQEAISE